MTEGNKPNQNKKPLEEKIDYDWRDPTKSRNPEDDVIVDGWRRRADGTFEKVKEVEEFEEVEENEQNLDDSKEDS
ncbi:MAG: hypothetical protein HC903_04265 [Methylacidiphilales bacterium]|nr:hypothetical protein [Candidatus Methylacidiphilales bacterium]NJR17365.1 hypothetical protein [Calothrix sp. CSU_2_0]